MPYKKPVEPPKVIRRNGLMFDIPQPGEVLVEAKPIKTKKPKAEKIKRKADPKLISAARELRDRWLEQVNSGANQLPASGKYEIGRSLEGSIKTVKQLAAA